MGCSIKVIHYFFKDSNPYISAEPNSRNSNSQWEFNRSALGK